MKRSIGILFALLLIAGCGGQAPAPASAPAPDQSATATPAAPAAAATAPAGAHKYTIAVVPKGLGHQFWNTVKAGADAAGKDLDAEIIWNGPAKETEIPAQISIIEDMISRKVSAIVMAACDENALIDTIKKAMDAGIPVVTIDSGVKSDLPVSFVATDNIAGAKAAAHALSKEIGGSGKVGLIPFVPGAATSELREQGFKEGLKELPGLELVATIYCKSDVALAVQAAEDMMSKTPDLKGIFAANEAAAIGAAQAVDSAGKAGQVKIVAFDASEEELNALNKGTIQALIVQDPFRMGYDGVKTAIDHIQGKPVEKRIDTGVTVITKENLNTPEVQKLLHPL
jgi:ribose transport system substrate-binding protein